MFAVISLGEQSIVPIAISELFSFDCATMIALEFEIWRNNDENGY